MVKCYYISTISILYFLIVTIHLGVRYDLDFVWWLFGYVLGHIIFLTYMYFDSFLWRYTNHIITPTTPLCFNPFLYKLSYLNDKQEWTKLPNDDVENIVSYNFSMLIISIIINFFFILCYLTNLNFITK